MLTCEHRKSDEKGDCFAERTSQNNSLRVPVRMRSTQRLSGVSQISTSQTLSLKHKTTNSLYSYWGPQITFVRVSSTYILLQIEAESFKNIYLPWKTKAMPLCCMLIQHFKTLLDSYFLKCKTSWRSTLFLGFQNLLISGLIKGSWPLISTSVSNESPRGGLWALSSCLGREECDWL